MKIDKVDLNKCNILKFYTVPETLEDDFNLYVRMLRESRGVFLKDKTDLSTQLKSVKTKTRMDFVLSSAAYIVSQIVYVKGANAFSACNKIQSKNVSELKKVAVTKQALLTAMFGNVTYDIDTELKLLNLFKDITQNKIENLEKDYSEIFGTEESQEVILTHIINKYGGWLYE